MSFRPTLIISGAQTGADQAGLRAARALDIATGGYAPKYYNTETGHAPWLEQWGLLETDSEWDWAKRTELNIKLADATVIFGRRSRGSNLTERLCQQHQKPFMWVLMRDQPPQRHDRKILIHRFRLWLSRVKPDTLNVAGNRESVNPGIGQFVEYFLREAL